MRRPLPSLESLRVFEACVRHGNLRDGVTKPDPAIFRVRLSRPGIEDARSVFIDDSLANVHAAVRLGFRAIHFRDATQLRQDLILLRAMPRRSEVKSPSSQCDLEAHWQVGGSSSSLRP